MTEVNVDSAGLGRVADALTESGAALGKLADRVGRIEFTAEAAGSNYATAGRDLADGLVRVAEWLSAWRTAIDASAAGTGAGSIQYAAADESMRDALQAVGDLP